MGIHWIQFILDLHTLTLKEFHRKYKKLFLKNTITYVFKKSISTSQNNLIYFEIPSFFFIFFNIFFYFRCEDYSASDYVEFSNFITTDRKFKKHCGTHQDLTVKSDGRFFRITLKTNDRLDGNGFRAMYVFEATKTTTSESNFLPQIRVEDKNNSAIFSG